jgi:hypothetical protein
MVKAETERAGFSVRVVPLPETMTIDEGEDLSFMSKLTTEQVTVPMDTESGVTNIANGADSVVVTFSNAKTDTTLRFTTLSVINTIDPNHLKIFPTLVTSQLTTGFTVQLNAKTNSSNYQLSWAVTLP